MPTIAITGSTGHIGGLVAAELADAAPVLVVRDAARAPQLPGAHVRVADYADPEASRAALDAVDVLLMVSASEAVDRREQHRSFVAAATEAGVGHIIYTSFVGAAPDSTFTLARDHADTEQAIRDSGMAWTILRDNLYIDVLPHFADADGVIRGPAGEGRVAAVARVDVAAVASAVLRDPAAHVRRTYDLTGPEALSLDEVAARAGAALGRELRYRPETLDEAYASRAEHGAPQWQLDAWVSTYTAIAAGELAAVSDDIRRLLRRDPLTLERALVGA